MSSQQNNVYYMQDLGTYAPVYETLRKARRCLGISKSRLAKRMGVPYTVWMKYESGQLKIPSSIILKVFMFGLDFWCERDL